MGLFDDFDIDMDEVKEAGGFSFEDGWYDFEVVEALRQNGTKADPDDTKFIIKFDLDEAGTYWDWYTLAVDGDSNHQKAKTSLGYLKTRLLELGLKASELNDFEPEDLEGIRGRFELKTTKGKNNREFQNIRNLTLEGAEEQDDEPDEEEFDTKAAKARVAANRAKRAEAEEKPTVTSRRRTVTKEEPTKPARTSRRRASDDEDDQDNPFG